MKFLTALLSLIFLSTGANAQKYHEHHHPFYYTAKRIKTARMNIDKYSWAQNTYAEMISIANEVMEYSDEELISWISEYNTTRVCNCPNCKTDWKKYIWKWDIDKPDEIVCRICGAVVSLEKYPENGTITLTDLQGKEHKHPVYKDEDGNIFQIRARINYEKLIQVQTWLDNLGMVYAVTQNSRYAQKAAVLLKRLAEVYPGYPLHDWYRYGTKPWNLAGKITGWNYNDAQLLTVCGMAYDAIYHSGVLENRDKAFIEEYLFKDAGNFLTALKPSDGISNDIPFRFAGVAMIGRTLEDHAILNWVLDKEEGFPVFVAFHFYQDGFWYERSPSYQLMAIKEFHNIINILEDYSDPDSYKGKDAYKNINLRNLPKIKNIYSCLYKTVYPDGTLPPINDSHAGEKPPVLLAEVGYSLFGTLEWLSLLNSAYGDDLENNGTRYALFFRNPDVDSMENNLYHIKKEPLKSMDFPGLGMAMLRVGSGISQTAFTMKYGKYTSDHCHFDALGITLFSHGKDMLSDLGYLYWMHKNRGEWMRRSLSHNTVTIDKLNQDAAGELIRFFYSGKHLSAFDAEVKNAYQLVAENFDRQIALVNIDDKTIYAVDFFRVKGGNVHDWSLHAESQNLELTGIDLLPAEGSFTGYDYAYRHISNESKGTTSASWAAHWRWDDGAGLYCHILPQDNCEIFRATAPGERHREEDSGKTLPYLFSRRTGENLKSEFIAVYEPYGYSRFIKKTEKFTFAEDGNWARVLKVVLSDRTDYIFSAYLFTPKSPFTDGGLSIKWKNRFGLVSVKNNKVMYEEWIQ